MSLETFFNEIKVNLNYKIQSIILCEYNIKIFNENNIFN